MISTKKIKLKVNGRPIKSERVAQIRRPNPLKSPITPTMTAAAPAVMAVMDWAIGEAADTNPIPQVMLMKNMNHKK